MKIPDHPAWLDPKPAATVLYDAALSAYFEGELIRSIGRDPAIEPVLQFSTIHDLRVKPGDFYLYKLTDEDRESLKQLTSADANNVRLDAIGFLFTFSQVFGKRKS